jgi:hypothetical protein
MTHQPPPAPTGADPLDWKAAVIIFLTIVFVALYVLGITGWWTALTPNKDVIGPVAPIVAVIIGYYFGRMPAEKNEKALQHQVNQKTQEASEAREEQKETRSDRDKLSAKVDAAKAALGAAAPEAEPTALATTLSGPTSHALDPAATRSAVVAALKVLDS